MSLLTQDPAAGTNPPGSPPPGNPPPATDWRTGLPEDIRNEKVFEAIKGKDWNEAGPLLAKNYVHAQKLIGTDKIVPLTDTSTPEEISAYYKKLGRPDTPDGYTFKLPEGLKEEQLDKERVGAWRKELHEAGLTAKQAERVISRYLNEEFTGRGAQEQAAAKQQETWVNGIKQEWGVKFDENMNYARLALKDFGSPALVEALESSGFGSHPEVVKAFAQIGRRLADDKARTGGQSQSSLASPEAAQQALTAFNRNAEKQKILFDERHPEHKNVVKERQEIFAAAFPPEK